MWAKREVEKAKIVPSGAWGARSMQRVGVPTKNGYTLGAGAAGGKSLRGLGVGGGQKGLFWGWGAGRGLEVKNGLFWPFSIKKSINETVGR